MLIVQAFAGIVTVSVGHCHPKVVQAVDKQNHLLSLAVGLFAAPVSGNDCNHTRFITL